MFLKVLTTTFFLFGILLLVAWPFVIGPQPDAELGKNVLADYAVKMAFYILVLSVAWMGAAVCAWLLTRKLRKELAGRRTENMRGLVEGTLKDHGRKQK
ncbi:MAG: hypothetical protein IH944_09065 [Armatimonadetes bacterium]|nr:hypothetical protein [Armatimonadota bacterium]